MKALSFLHYILLVFILLFGSFKCKTRMDFSPEQELTKQFFATLPNKILTKFLLLNKKIAIGQFYQFRMIAYYSNLDIPFDKCTHCLGLEPDHVHDELDVIKRKIIRNYMITHIEEFFDFEKYYQLMQLSLEFNPNNDLVKEFGLHLSLNLKMLSKAVSVFNSVYNKHPSWHLAFYSGWIYLYYLKDFDQARIWFKKSMNFKDAPQRAYNLYQTTFALDQKYDVAIKMTQENLLKTINPGIRQKLKEKLKWFQGMSLLTHKAKEFENKFKKPIKNLKDLITASLLSSLPEDPLGQGFSWDDKALEVISQGNPLDIIASKKPFEPDTLDFLDLEGFSGHHHEK